MTEYGVPTQLASFFETRGMNTRLDFSFCIVKLNKLSMYEYVWNMMHIDQDLIAFLKEYHRLPSIALEEPYKIIKEKDEEINKIIKE